LFPLPACFHTLVHAFIPTAAAASEEETEWPELATWQKKDNDSPIVTDSLLLGAGQAVHGLFYFSYSG